MHLLYRPRKPESQRQWAGKPLTEDSIKLFPLRCEGKTESEPNEDGKSSIVKLGDGFGFDPLRHIVPHGSYLTNLCHSGEEQRKKSYDNFLTELKMAEALGIGLFNFHPGSTLGQPREEAYKYLAGCINDAHEETEFIVVLLENMVSLLENRARGRSEPNSANRHRARISLEDLSKI
jgi:endonuclease IV